MWAFDRKSNFKKQYKNLSQEKQNLVKKALKELDSSQDPTQFGKFKASMKVYAYEFGKSERILYAVNFTDKIITLFRVGDHKDVYGKG